MLGNLNDLAATGLASEPTLRAWIKAEPDQSWIIKRGSNGDAYEIDLEGAVVAWREKEERAAAVARSRTESIRQFAMDLGISAPIGDDGGTPMSILERRQLLEEELVAMRVAKERGDLISFAEASAALADVLMAVRKFGETFAARVAKKIDLDRAQIAAIELQIERDHADLASILERAEGSIGNRSIIDTAPRAAAKVDVAAKTNGKRPQAKPGRHPKAVRKTKG